MALEIEWSRSADKKFDTIIEYLQKEWGEKSVNTFVKKVYDFLDILVEFPNIGTPEDKTKNIFGFVVVSQITIFYRIKSNRIILLNFFDNRQDPNKKRF
jgi:plasmid stabilization system protein ParE